MTAHVILIGTVHRDPEGYDRLLAILHEENPDCLTLEISPYAVRFRRKRRLALKKRVRDIVRGLARELPFPGEGEPVRHPAVRRVLAVIDFPYEYRAAAAFSRSKNMPFYCIDRSDFSREKISRLERELVTRENLRALIQFMPHEAYREIPREFRLASMALGRSQEAPFRNGDDQEMSARDRFMASKIRALLNASENRRLVHIGGWEHLIDDRNRDTLFRLLSDLRPQRRLLSR
jgi:hypothetical protein